MSSGQTLNAIVPELLCVLSGFIMIVFRKKLSATRYNWNKKFGNVEGDANQYQWGFLIFGAAFLIFGIMIILGVIEFRK